MKPFWHFARRMLRYRRLMAIAFIAALLDAACAFGGFGALMWIIDALFTEGQGVRQALTQKLSSDEVQRAVGDLTFLTQWIPERQFYGFAFILGIILVLALIGSTMRFINQSVAFTITLRVVMRIRRAAFQRLLHTPMELVGTEGVADNLNRIVRDTMQLARGFNALMGKAVRDILMGMTFLLLALLIDWKLTGIFLLGLPLIAFCIRKFGKSIRRATKRAMRAYGKMTASVQESIQGLQVVKVHHAEGYERRRFNTINRQVLAQELKARTARALSAPVIELLAIVGVMTVSLVAAWYVFELSQGQPTDMVTVLMALGMAGVSFRPLATLNNDLQEAAAAAGRIDEVLRLPVEGNTRRDPRNRLNPLPRHSKSIDFESISYHYPNVARAAIEGIDLHVVHGQTVAIVGPNGAGKSTLLSLVPRLIEPTHGRVLIDGVDIATSSLRSVRKQMAMVTQQTILFEGSIADNIAYGRRYTPLDQIERAARAAFAHEFIASLPQGYATMLGEAGAGLSGGQKQRLCIARAILRDPAILILDEATSQIDADSEAKITEALQEFRKGRTTFVIAHRLSTVVDADLIVVMHNGQVIDQGSHSELLARCEIYQMLTRTQLLPASDTAAAKIQV
jgi:ABC-type multidrug transport system fused ATPase/permease subunit